MKATQQHPVKNPFAKIAVVIVAAVAVTLGLAGAAWAQWVPDDGDSSGYTWTQDHDDDGAQGTGIRGFTTLITSFYYDHGSHLHSDLVHVHFNDTAGAGIQITDVHVRTYQGKCDHPDGSAWSFPACRDSGTLGPKESDLDFPSNWGPVINDRDFAIHNRIPIGSGYQVIDYYYNCTKLLVSGCGVRNHEQSENALGYIP